MSAPAMLDAGPPPLDATAKPPMSSSAGAPSAGSNSVAGSAAAGSGGNAGMRSAAGGGGAGQGTAGTNPIDANVPDAMPAAGAPAPATEPCKPSSYVKGNNRVMLQHQNRTRRYVVYVPSSLDPMVRSPLVIDFHGNTSSAAQEQGGSGWQQKADQEKFIAVFPDGVGSAWNVGNCCGTALSEMVDDVGFAKAIVAAVSEAACVDPKRVYATGISNGAGLSHRLACEAADVFAAIAAASADLVTDPCKPARPISELSVRGVADTLVAYEGGNTGSTGWYSPGAKGTLELWKKINGCTGPIEKNKQYCETYTQCAGNVEVTLCSLPNTGHILYDNSLGFDVPEVAWEMFLQHPMP